MIEVRGLSVYLDGTLVITCKSVELASSLAYSMVRARDARMADKY